MDPRFPAACPNCKSTDLYTRRTPTNQWLPFLRGLGGFLRYATMDVVLCSKCGHCMFFADNSARQKVKTSKSWLLLKTDGGL
ncbi:hypothetical protein [Humisphaera borealis]|uniref:Uncharacterized protein n=1 Tax=Humisphaera borealis TaxID=2807512 RepID=A0A7M2WQK3_9BACT|nr:hypothetical protein [Humisphaera borealis]QOV87778.1 hypothetical protein IPV69_15970 [Humisphaera borealis]